ncbi:hypothetical protein Trydic_g13354 [Trypoxylus dichotomus]
MDLKEALLQTVSCMLSQDYEIRRLAEERQKALEVTDDYSLHLVEILLTTDEALDERQMASILLNKYIKAHWHESNEGFIEPEVTENTKRKLRNVLPSGLGDDVPKIQKAVAATLAMIAINDYPHDWESLQYMLLSKLYSQNRNEIIGGLIFTNELTKRFCKEQLSLLTPVIYEPLYQICRNDAFLSEHRTLVINMAFIFFAADYYINETPNDRLESAIEKFCELFIEILSQPYSLKSTFAVKSEIFQFLSNANILFPNLLKRTLEKSISVSWSILRTCAVEYIKFIMDQQTCIMDFHEKDANVHYLSLIRNIFCVLGSAFLDVDIGQKFAYENLHDILSIFVTFMTITSDIQDSWYSDEELFYSDESGDTVETNLRTYLKHLLQTLIHSVSYERFDEIFRQFLIRKVEETNTGIENITYWWRTHESLMYMLQLAFDVFKKDSQHMNVHLAQVATWTSFLSANLTKGFYLLHMRVLLLGGTLSKYLGRDELIIHINTILESLMSSNILVRLSAIMALEKHCEQINNEHQYAHEFARNIKNITERLISIRDLTPRLCYIVLKCLQSLIMVNRLEVPDLLEKLVPYLRTLFWKNMSIPGFMEVYNSLIGELSKNSYCMGYIHNMLLPDIIKDISMTTDKIEDVADVQCVGINVLQTIIENIPVSINHQLIEESLTSLYKVIMTADDASVIWHAVSCICYFLYKAADKIFAIRDSSGQNGLDFIMNIIKHILEPQMGDAISQHVDCIIKSTLTRMNFFNNPSCNEGLLIIFVYLCHTHTEILMNTLSVIPGPNGGSALSFIFTRWVLCYRMFPEDHEYYLSLIALANILHFAMLKNDEQFLNTKILIPRKSTYLHEVEMPLSARILEILVESFDILNSSSIQNENYIDEGYEFQLDHQIFEGYFCKETTQKYLKDFLRTFSQRNVLTMYTEQR